MRERDREREREREEIEFKNFLNDCKIDSNNDMEF
jgi:hypothetical protein